MPTGTFQYQDEAERLSIETAIAFVAEMRQLALSAPNGQVVASSGERRRWRVSMDRRSASSWYWNVPVGMTSPP